MEAPVPVENNISTQQVEMKNMMTPVNNYIPNIEIPPDKKTGEDVKYVFGAKKFNQKRRNSCLNPNPTFENALASSGSTRERLIPDSFQQKIAGSDYKDAMSSNPRKFALRNRMSTLNYTGAFLKPEDIITLQNDIKYIQ